MTDSIKPSATSGSEDPWEQLAEDLFGLEYGKEHASHEPSTPSPPPVVAPSEEPPAVTFEEPTSDRGSESEISPTPVADAEIQESSSQYAEPAVRPATTGAQDSYWDALANFNWGESERPATRNRPPAPRRDESPRSAGASSRDDTARDVKDSDDHRSLAPTPRTATGRTATGPAESRADSRRAASDDAGDFGDFGLGVEDSVGGVGSPQGDAFAPQPFTHDADAVDADEFDDDEGDDTGISESETAEPPTADEEGAPRKRRRRRRRRRSRQGGEGTSAATPSAAGAPEKVPGEDWDETAPAPVAPRKDTPRNEGPRREDRPRRSVDGRRDSGRRDERSRGPRRRPEERREPSAAPAPEQRRRHADDDFGAESSEDEIMNVGGGEGTVEFTLDEGGGEGSDSLTDFGEVPTWEEAISYLLNPQRVQVDSNGGSEADGSDSRTSSSSRQTRHYGGRR